MKTPRQLTCTLTLATLTALVLTGCGQKELGTIPDADSSSSVASSPQVGQGSESAESTPEETATAEETQNYSGGSKAPLGEYRPADELGPAQNVPKPQVPAGMNVETTEGMEIFIGYWNDMRNYALQTGDVRQIRALVDESFTQEQDFYTALEDVYESGGWVIEGGLTVHYNKSLLTPMGEGEYSIGSNFEVNDSVLWLDGEATYSDNSDSIYEGVDFRLKFEDGRWRVLSAQVVS